MRISILLFLLYCILTACNSTKNLEDSKADKSQIESLAKERYKGPFQIHPSEKHQYSLVVSRTKTLKMLFPTVHYFVFDHKSNTVLTEDDLPGGSVHWASEHEIKATRRAASSDSEEVKNSYFYNCKTNEWFEDE